MEVRGRLGDGRMYTNVTNNFRKPHRGDCDAAERAANDPCPPRGVVARIDPCVEREDAGERRGKKEERTERGIGFFPTRGSV